MLKYVRQPRVRTSSPNNCYLHILDKLADTTKSRMSEPIKKARKAASSSLLTISKPKKHSLTKSKSDIFKHIYDPKPSKPPKTSSIRSSRVASLRKELAEILSRTTLTLGQMREREAALLEENRQLRLELGMGRNV